MEPKLPEPKSQKAVKSMGTENRSERASIIQAARLATGGNFGVRARSNIEKEAKDKIRATFPGLKKGQIEEKLKEMVRSKGLGKLSTKTALRNSIQNKVRASQIKLAITDEVQV